MSDRAVNSIFRFDTYDETAHLKTAATRLLIAFAPFRQDASHKHSRPPVLSLDLQLP
jgi:hypothetical protein